MNSLAALLAEADAIIAQGDTDADPLLVAYAAVEMLPRVVAALRPFAAPVGVEAFEELRRACRCGSLRQRAGTCRCGADAHNALLDQCIAAHVAALGEVERLRAEARKAVDLLAAAGGALSVEGPAIPELAKNCDATARAISAALKGDQ